MRGPLAGRLFLEVVFASALRCSSRGGSSMVAKGHVLNRNEAWALAQCDDCHTVAGA
jgi:hypothetical protein